MKPILCLDFDGVIHSYKSGWKGPRNIPDEPVPNSIEFILSALKEWNVVIHSSRANYFGGISAMRKWLRKHSGSLWNETMFGPGIESVNFSKTKPSAQVTIDDRALTFKGQWPDLDTIRDFKPWNKQ